EFIQEPTVQFCKKLTALLPDSLNCVYPVNSGTEANEAALKLVKRVTGRQEIVSFRGSYHGSTHGSMSVSGNELKKQAFRPLLPDIRFIEHNQLSDLKNITTKTAGVILETIQGDAGVRIPDINYLIALRKRCTEVGALLIFDEIQCGMGRTAKLFAFEHFGVAPDVLTLGKALGGGLPIGALVSSKEYLSCFTHNPMLGHITTFGGNPLISAAANATLEVLTSEVKMDEVEAKGLMLENELKKEQAVIAIRRKGLMLAIDLKDAETVEKIVKNCLENGLLSFWFLSHPYSFRLSPPLTISNEEIQRALKIIHNAFISIQ
ncbi:MAG: aspartate aminotransferase family protein, partial [Bacteroidetes bacterium]|nr:aspartate aminotransferase family protein [Bacteroidota bacterium]